MPTAILGLATSAPARSIAQADAAALAREYGVLTAEQERLLPTLYRRTRVARRGSVLIEENNGHGLRQSFYRQAVEADDRGPTTRERMLRYADEALPLALPAAREALAEAHVEPREITITQLITVTCTGFVAPGLDVALMRELGLPATTGRTQIGFMGCHGAMNGLRTLHAMTRSDPAARVLMVAVELCSLHYHYGWDPQKIVANALFADGAAAVVGGATDPPANGHGEPWRLAASGSCVFPDSEDAMTWVIGDHGFEMTLSPRVPDLIGAHLRPWAEAWLGKCGLRLSDVASWAIHPGGPRIVSSALAALGLPESAGDVSNQVLAEHGNMSSPTVLFILERMRRAQAPRPCVALGFGPGLAVEAALLV
jgi:predicted naringenin-chalcone synthase